MPDRLQDIRDTWAWCRDAALPYVAEGRTFNCPAKSMAVSGQPFDPWQQQLSVGFERNEAGEVVGTLGSDQVVVEEAADA